MYNKARLVLANTQPVSFTYRDYADDNYDKVMTLSNDEFIRRHLQRVLITERIYAY
ncbi:transposase [Pseudoalteromonas sp. DY56-GL79]|uniref:transposase n=1 Tax=Pseudoalteromonas sp. DY56-GL79 TaxID=2967131 RepID=UPI00352AB21E